MVRECIACGGDGYIWYSFSDNWANVADGEGPGEWQMCLMCAGTGFDDCPSDEDKEGVRDGYRSIGT